MISAIYRRQEKSIAMSPLIVIEATGKDILEEHDPVSLEVVDEYAMIYAAQFVGDRGFMAMMHIRDTPQFASPVDLSWTWQGIVHIDGMVHVDRMGKPWFRCDFPVMCRGDAIRLDITAGDDLSCDAKFDLRFALVVYEAAPWRCP